MGGAPVLKLLYSFIHTLGFLFFLPVVAYRALFKGKYRQNFRKKLFPPKIEKGSKPLVYLHGASVGEVLAFRPLYDLFLEEGKYDLVFSSGTETGLAQAKKHFPKAKAHVYLPFDFAFSVRPLIHRLSPEMVVLSEGDYWLNFLSEAKNVGAKIYVVNGKLSKTSESRLSLIPFFTQKLFGLVDHFFLQSEAFLKRFENLGVPKEKLTVTGSLKLDLNPKVEPKETVKKSFGLEGGDPILVFGSTHPKEEDLALKVYETVKGDYPNLKLVIVPRHPERFDKVAADIEARGYSLSRYTSLKPEAPILLVDAIGQLMTLYSIADLAIVCGSFYPGVGGHNIIEPCFFGSPTLYGPVLHSQPALLTLSREYRAGMEVEAGELEKTVASLLKNPDERKKLSENGMRLIENCRGAAKRTYLGLR